MPSAQYFCPRSDCYHWFLSAKGLTYHLCHLKHHTQAKAQSTATSLDAGSFNPDLNVQDNEVRQAL